MNVSTPQQVDVAIIGAGTAGLAAYRAAARETDRVLLIEGGHYGTTCARVGCMPSKLLIAAADAAHHVEQAHRFGIEAPRQAPVIGRKVMARVRSERDRFVGFVTRSVEEIPERHRMRGHARFIDANTLDVDGRRIQARTVVIATGSRPRVPAMFEPLGDRAVINDDVFNWEDLPRAVAVFGPGVVGLELGQAFHRLGVRVRMFGTGGFIGPLTDPQVKAEAARLFNEELSLDPDARVHAVRRTDHGIEVVFDDARGNRQEERFDLALVAVGRVPNVDRLGLDHTGLELDRRGVPRYDTRTLRCGETSIFIAGDANADVPVLHEASDEGQIAGTNAVRYPNVQPFDRRSSLGIVFSDPQIAMTGETWGAVKDRDPIVGRVSFENQGRSRVIGRNRGLLHVYADRETGRFLGAELVGPSAEHLGHLLAWAHQQRLTIAAMLAMPFYHPVIEEGLRTALRDASSQLGTAQAA